MSDSIDWAVDENGDLLIGPDGDILQAKGQKQIAQEILFRLKTSKGDYTVDPNVGANLESFIGSPNTQNVRDEIVKAVEEELQRDEFIPLRKVRALKTDVNSVLIVVEYLDIKLNRIQWTATLDLNDGSIRAR